VLELVADLKSPHFASIALQASNTELTLNLGYSHPVVIPVPKDIQVLVRRSPLPTRAATSSAVSAEGGDAETVSGCCVAQQPNVLSLIVVLLVPPPCCYPLCSSCTR